jgi:hypothetical protein
MEAVGIFLSSYRKYVMSKLKSYLLSYSLAESSPLVSNLREMYRNAILRSNGYINEIKVWIIKGESTKHKWLFQTIDVNN